MRQEQSMIAKLTGTLDDTGPDWAVIDVAGVGYFMKAWGWQVLTDLQSA